MPSKIHVVVGTHEYEGSDVLRAFRKSEHAEAFAEKLRDYARHQPQRDPNRDDEADWDAYEAAMGRWRKRCPGGPSNVGFDSYTVYPIAFIEG